MPVARVIIPLRSPMASEAFMIRFIRICRSCVAALDRGESPGEVQPQDAFFGIAACSRCAISSITAVHAPGRNDPLPEYASTGS